MEEEPQEQQKKQNYDWLKQYQFQKGVSGNPGGRPKGKSLKTFAREMLESMSDEEKAKFMKKIEPKIVWEMAEGKPKQDTELKGHLTISDLLDSLENDGQTPSEQGMETEESL